MLFTCQLRVSSVLIRVSLMAHRYSTSEKASQRLRPRSIPELCQTEPKMWSVPHFACLRKRGHRTRVFIIHRFVRCAFDTVNLRRIQCQDRLRRAYRNMPWALTWLRPGVERAPCEHNELSIHVTDDHIVDESDHRRPCAFIGIEAPNFLEIVR